MMIKYCFFPLTTSVDGVADDGQEKFWCFRQILFLFFVLRCTYISKKPFCFEFTGGDLSKCMAL